MLNHKGLIQCQFVLIHFGILRNSNYRKENTLTLHICGNIFSRFNPMSKIPNRHGLVFLSLYGAPRRAYFLQRTLDKRNWVGAEMDCPNASIILLASNNYRIKLPLQLESTLGMA